MTHNVNPYGVQCYNMCHDCDLDGFEKFTLSAVTAKETAFLHEQVVNWLCNSAICYGKSSLVWYGQICKGVKVNLDIYM